MLSECLKYWTFSGCFWSIIICILYPCLEILIIFVFYTFISIPYNLPISISLSVMPCSTDSVLDSSTSSSAYYTVRITCPILKSPNPSVASLVKYSLYKLSRNGDKQHPSLTLFPVFTLGPGKLQHFFNWINQPDAATSQVYYLSFKYSSTCFGHPHAHHQELQQLQ
jgi:hypothetical protein